MVSTKEEIFKKYTDSKTMKKIVKLDTMFDFLHHLENYKSLKAIERLDRSVATYDEVLEDIGKVHTYLKDNNINKGDLVGVYAGNNYEFAIMSIGVISYGAVGVLIPVQIKNEILFGLSKKYALKTILYEDRLKENIMEGTTAFPYSELEKLTSELIDNKIKPDDKAAIIFTGGTTGKSKGALLSHKNILTGTINGCYGLKNVFNEVYYSIMPLTHVFGFIRNLLTALYTGSAIYFNYNKAEMFKDMQMINPTELVVVPALAEMFLKLVNQFGIKMLGTSLKTVIAGGAAVPQYLIEEYDKLGITMCPGYGLTELANMVSGNPEPIKKPNSVGLLFPGLEAKLVNDELWLKGDNLMLEYYGEDEENKNAFEDGYFKTGDLARFDEDNYLYITGRIKDIIVLSNGENISPAELETEFNKLSIIEDSLVYEKDDSLVLEVLPRAKEAKDLSEEDIKKLINEVNDNLPSYERIKTIIIRDKDFDRSPSMKIIRPKGE